MMSRLCGFVLVAGSFLLSVGCSKHIPAKKKKDAQELVELKNEVLKRRAAQDYEGAIASLQRIIREHPDHEGMNNVKLMLADSFMKVKQYPAAFTLYDNFVLNYPSDKQSEFARYQAILAKFYQTLSPDRDQTVTQETMTLCDAYLASLSNQMYRKDVADIYNTCEQKLIDKELYVYNFYLNKGEYQAAGKRLEYLREHYLGKQKEDLEPRLMFLECKLAEAQHKHEALEKIAENLCEIYPESLYARMAQAFVEKHHGHDAHELLA